MQRRPPPRATGREVKVADWLSAALYSSVQSAEVKCSEAQQCTVRYTAKQNTLQWCVRAKHQEAGRRNCDPWSSQVPTDLNHVLKLTSTLSLPFSSLLFPRSTPCTFSISLCSYLFFISPPPHPLSKPPVPFVSPSARVNLLAPEQIL